MRVRVGCGREKRWVASWREGGDHLAPSGARLPRSGLLLTGPGERVVCHAFAHFAQTTLPPTALLAASARRGAAQEEGHVRPGGRRIPGRQRRYRARRRRRPWRGRERAALASLASHLAVAEVSPPPPLAAERLAAVAGAARLAQLALASAARGGLPRRAAAGVEARGAKHATQTFQSGYMSFWRGEV